MCIKGDTLRSREIKITAEFAQQSWEESWKRIMTLHSPDGNWKASMMN